MTSREASKGPEAFRTISEASSELGVPQHVLRFWETKFSFIRPMKRAGGRRFYRRQDLEVLKGVRMLLHEGGYTIKGVQRLHKEAGVRRLIGAGEGDLPPPASAMASSDHGAAPEAADIFDAVAGATRDNAPERTAVEPLDPRAFPDRAPTPSPAPEHDAGILKRPARARLEAVLRDLEDVKAHVDGLLSESDA